MSADLLRLLIENLKNDLPNYAKVVIGIDEETRHTLESQRKLLGIYAGNSYHVQVLKRIGVLDETKPSYFVFTPLGDSLVEKFRKEGFK